MNPFVIFILLLSFQNLFADQTRLSYSFKSLNGFFELKPSDTIFSDNKTYIDSTYNPSTKKHESFSYSYPDRYFWGLYDLRNNEKLYTLKNDSLFIEFKTARISDNGKQIIIVDDNSGKFGFPHFDSVYFYKTNKLIKTLKLGDLLDNMCSVSYSISHMKWCFDFDFTEDDKFEIKTFEYFNYKFDLEGNLIEKVSDIRISATDDILTGKIKRLEKDKYSFKIKKSIRNKHEPETELIIEVSDKTMRKIHGKFYGFLPARNKRMETEFYATILFRNNEPILSEIRFPSYNGYDSCNIINKRKSEFYSQ